MQSGKAWLVLSEHCILNTQPHRQNLTSQLQHTTSYKRNKTNYSYGASKITLEVAPESPDHGGPGGQYDLQHWQTAPSSSAADLLEAPEQLK